MATRPKPTPKDSEENGARPTPEDLERYIAPLVGPDDERVFTDSGIEIEPLYDETDVAPDLPERLGEPGHAPFPRGIHVGERSYVALEAIVLAHDMTRAKKTHTRIGRNCFIGAGAIVLPGVTIGEGAIIGAGATSTPKRARAAPCAATSG